MKYYSYDNFKVDTNILIKKMQSFNPEAIVAIARGGMSLAQAIAEGLDLRDVQSIRTELYDDTQMRDTLKLFGSCDFGGKKRVLVVDDIADSGQTLEAVMENLQRQHPNVVFKSATLFYKKSSIVEPHFWINEADDWIDFFWERDFKSD